MTQSRPLSDVVIFYTIDHARYYYTDHDRSQLILAFLKRTLIREPNVGAARTDARFLSIPKDRH